MTRKELLARIGSVEQIGGIRDFTFHGGKADGVRAIEVNTGFLRFLVLPDRCMDIAQADYCGMAFAWISKTGITAPTYYEKDGKSWLRGFYGGLLTTCGLQNIGSPYAEHGLHGRIANTPAVKVSIFADWVGDDYVMRLSGEMRESAVFGENLVLKRTLSTKLFAKELTVEDTVVNEGFEDASVALCYHCNFGYPLVSECARLINVPEAYGKITPPIHGQTEACIPVPLAGQTATVGIEGTEFGVYLTYRRDTLPEFLLWEMLGESEYVLGLEPRTTNLGGKSIQEQDAYVRLKPFEERRMYLNFKIKEIGENKLCQKSVSRFSDAALIKEIGGNAVCQS